MHLIADQQEASGGYSLLERKQLQKVLDADILESFVDLSISKPAR